jgi:hypothetical protein
MALTGKAMLILTVLLVLGVVAATMLCWSRLDAIGAARWPVRALLIGGCQFTAVALAALLINDQFVFYQSWSELLGSHPTQDRPVTEQGSLDARLAPELLAHFRQGQGSLVSLPIAGLRSGVRTGPATVYLPPQYGDPAMADRSFPVVELLSGFPGGPVSWVRDLHVGTELNSLIDSGRSAPFIAVIPVQNVASPRDTECVNVPGGPQVDSYLTYDVRTAVQHAFRASHSGAQWTALGYSTGGYCAEDLSIRHPGMFSAAVSLAGYNSPAHDPTTENLFGKDRGLAELYTPTWLLQHRPIGALHLLLVSTKADRISLYEARQLAALDRPPLQVALLTLPRGGHNFGTFAAELPVGFSWLSRYVAGPLAPIPTVDGQSPEPVPYHSGRHHTIAA